MIKLGRKVKVLNNIFSPKLGGKLDELNLSHEIDIQIKIIFNQNLLNLALVFEQFNCKDSKETNFNTSLRKNLLS